MIKVLHVLSSLDGGGVERMLYNYYTHMTRSKVHFDFVVHGKKIGILEEPLKKFGSEIYHVTPKKESLFKNCSEIYRAINSSKYDVVVVHQNFSSFPALAMAFLGKVKSRIIHSHGCNLNEKMGFDKKMYRLMNYIFATDFAVCSQEAGSWLYGKQKKGNVKVIYNTIDEEKFKFNIDTRKKIRHDLKIPDNGILLLQVGRFSEEKNQEFSIEIFDKLNDDNFFLVFAGDGNEQGKIEKKASMLKNKEKILFLGCVNNVDEVMCAADVLLFPSKHEGFPVVSIEAQVCGLPVLASDAISKSTNISDNITYLPIDNTEKWLESLLELDIKKERKSIYDERFDASRQSSHYEKYLTETINKNKRNKVQ